MMPQPYRRKARAACTALLVAATLMVGLPGAQAETEKVEFKLVPAVPLPVPQDAKAAKKHKKLIEAAREYFDLNESPWTSRKRFEAALATAAKQGMYPLADVKFLRWLVAQGRSFLPAMTDRKWARANNVEVKDRKIYGFELKGAKLWMHVRAPKKYNVKKLEAVPRAEPLPVVFVMHDKRDPEGKDGAGVTWLKRNWDRKVHAKLYEDWFMVMPIVAAAAYSDDNKIRHDRVQDVLRAFWNHYHMDYARVVIDGSTDALLFAVTNGNLFGGAGLVLRDVEMAGDDIANPKIKASLQNIAHLPVYVVNKPKVAKALRDGGVASVTEGDGAASLVTWLEGRSRTVPRSFKWTIAGSDQVLAHWLHMDSLFETASGTRFVEVAPPEEGKGNTIDIKATGVSEMSLFLDDDLVDLDQPIIVNINGKEVHNAKIEVKDKYKPIKRDLREIFEKKPVDVKQFRYYGWLKPASIVRLIVPELEEKKVITRKIEADPKQQADAAKLCGKAHEAFEAGNFPKALRLVNKLLEIPWNAHSDKGQVLKVKIEEKMKEDEGK